MTKRIGNIRKQFLKRERLMLILEYWMRSEKQRDWSPSARKAWIDFSADAEENIDRICWQLRYRVWTPGEFNIFKKKEGEKVRCIYESKPEDLVVDTLFLDCLEYVFMERKKIVHDNCYGSIKGRGQHELRKRIIDAVHHRTDLYAYVGDTSKYYPTMNHEVLMDIFRQHIKDDWMLWLCQTCVNRIEGEVGIALGLPSSNLIGHIYHAAIDWDVTMNRGVRRYFRFCDDKFMLHRDKSYLHTMARVVRDNISKDLLQTVKPTWRVVHCEEQPFECLGALINSHGAKLRQTSRRRIERHFVRCIRRKSPETALRTWSGIKGGLRDLSVSNLIGFWHDRYPEFFELVREAHRLHAVARRHRKHYKRMMKILTKAPDMRSEANKIKFPYGPVNPCKKKAA